MKNFKNKKTLQICLFVLVAVVTLGIGYAAISAINLFINGNATATVNQNNFRVYFKTAGGVTGTSGVSGTTTIDEQDDTVAYFDVSGLTKSGDYGIATYTVENASNAIGAEISLNLTNSNNEYFKVTETIADTQLQAGDTTTATVRVEMIKTPIQDDVTTTITAKLTASPMEDASATGNSGASVVTTPDPVSFATDSWATIKKAVHNNNTSAYHVGDTKTVTIGANNYTVRIANKSEDTTNCSNSNYSQTACGFVVEFADIITTMQMRNSQTNVGGYPATLVYDYLNNTLLGQLPNDLQSVIEPTRVISGYGNNGTDSANFISTSQKLYLLSGVEVHGADEYDKAASTTSQLDYYVDMPSRAVKQYNGSDNWWWLRSARSLYNNGFRDVGIDGYLGGSNANYYTGGVSPAFRIA